VLNNKLILTDKIWKKIKSINKLANKIPYKTDDKVHGQLDFWTANLEKYKYGDCDDYMLYKRKLLINNGIPWECLLPATCMTNSGGHAVLIIRTTEGNYVLDNNTDKIRRLESFRFEGKKVKWLDWFDPADKCWYSIYPDQEAS
jgi:predicted transglutaminase-like cysteine proteinase